LILLCCQYYNKLNGNFLITYIDIQNDVHINNSLDDVLNELSNNSCIESGLLNEFQDDFDLSDLSELPLEDFTNIDSFLNEASFLNGSQSDTSIKMDGVMQVVSTSESTSSSDVDEFLEDISSQSSPTGYSPSDNEFNYLLDSCFNSDFMQEFLSIEGSKVSNVVTTDNTNSQIHQIEVVDQSQTFIEVGCKRMHPSSETISNAECSAGKLSKQEDNNQLSLIRIKEHETEKDAIRRVKNNEASKVTRAKRKHRQKDLIKQETELIKANAQLRIKMEVMQKEAEILRKVLVSKLSSSNS
jgi:Basic region leucine zipper.